MDVDPVATLPGQQQTSLPPAAPPPQRRPEPRQSQAYIRLGVYFGLPAPPVSWLRGFQYPQPVVTALDACSLVANAYSYQVIDQTQIWNTYRVLWQHLGVDVPSCDADAEFVFERGVPDWSVRGELPYIPPGGGVLVMEKRPMVLQIWPRVLWDGIDGTFCEVILRIISIAFIEYPQTSNYSGNSTMMRIYACHRKCNQLATAYMDELEAALHVARAQYARNEYGYAKYTLGYVSNAISEAIDDTFVKFDVADCMSPLMAHPLVLTWGTFSPTAVARESPRVLDCMNTRQERWTHLTYLLEAHKGLPHYATAPRHPLVGTAQFRTNLFHTNNWLHSDVAPIVDTTAPNTTYSEPNLTLADLGANVSNPVHKPSDVEKVQKAPLALYWRVRFHPRSRRFLIYRVIMSAVRLIDIKR